MNRDLIWWLVLAALILAGVVVFVVDHAQKMQEQAALFGPGACDEAAMVQAIRSYKTALIFGAVVMPVFGVIVSAALARRLRPELMAGERGTARRLVWGLLVGLIAVVALAALLFLLGGHCLRSALTPDEGLPSDVAAAMSPLGRLVPNFWIASALETVLLTVVSFFTLGTLSRFLSGGVARLRRT